MKKIIHVIDNLTVGGREKIVIDLCNNLNPKEFSVFLVTLSNKNLDLIGSLNSNVKHYCLQINIDNKLGIFIRLLIDRFAKSKLEKIVKLIEPDIIHTHSFAHRLLYITLIIRKFSRRVKHFHTVHTSGMYYEKKGVVNFFKLSIEKFAIKLTRPYLVAISEVVQENNLRFFKNISSNSRCIPNGINLNNFINRHNRINRNKWNESDSKIIITYVSRISEGKNHITLLKAFKSLVYCNKNVRLYLAGSGELEPLVNEFLLQNNLSDYVVLLGSISNVPELLSFTDIGVFPSEYEGFGLALLEMMAMKLPVVVANNPTFSRLISHKENGLLHSIYDSNELFECLNLILENKELANKISNGAEKTARIFSLENMIYSQEKYYLDVL